MDWGLMWYDDTAGRALEDKVARAAAQYVRKYGQPPTVCFVNPAAKNGTDQVGGVQVQTLKTIGPNYLWIGVGEVVRRRKSSRIVN
jgi:hypothetical protein